MPTTAEEKAIGWVSVTEVLDFFCLPELMEWKLKVGKKTANQISRQALKFGGEIDQIIKGQKQLSKASPIEVANCWTAFKRWQEDYGAHDLEFPSRLYDANDMTTGEPDCIWKGILIDFKAASSIKPNYWLQTAKYRVMGLPEPPNKTAILRLDKNLATYEFKTHEQAKVNLDQCVKAFDGLLTAYRFYRPNGSMEE